MSNDEYAARMAAIRQRFAAKVRDRIGEVDAALPGLTRDEPDALAALDAAHRRVHDLCGVGATLGFVGTSTAARVVERVLLAAARDRRGLTADEVATVRQGLVALRVAAEADIRSAATAEQSR